MDSFILLNSINCHLYMLGSVHCGGRRVEEGATFPSDRSKKRLMQRGPSRRNMAPLAEQLLHTRHCNRRVTRDQPRESL
jgi:hypothetical protein